MRHPITTSLVAAYAKLAVPQELSTKQEDTEVAIEAAMKVFASLSNEDPLIDNPTSVEHARQEYAALVEYQGNPDVFSAIIGSEQATAAGTTRTASCCLGTMRSRRLRPCHSHNVSVGPP